MPLTIKFKEKLLGDRRELSIVRGMIYNNLQEWKRRIYEPEGQLNVNGKVWEAMALSDGDMKFIDQEAMKLITMPPVTLTDEQAKAIAKRAYDSINSVPEAQRTENQKNFRQELMEALDMEEDIPF